MVPLETIEKAVRANFVIDKAAKKPLMTPWNWITKCRGSARTVFVGIALEQGYKQWDIRRYLKMSPSEYESQLIRYKKFMIEGSQKFEEVKQGLHSNHDKRFKTESRRIIYEDWVCNDIALRIYRKSLLVKSYVHMA